MNESELKSRKEAVLVRTGQERNRRIVEGADEALLREVKAETSLLSHRERNRSPNLSPTVTQRLFVPNTGTRWLTVQHCSCTSVIIVSFPFQTYTGGNMSSKGPARSFTAVRNVHTGFVLFYVSYRLSLSYQFCLKPGRGWMCTSVTGYGEMHTRAKASHSLHTEVNEAENRLSVAQGTY